jgi:hypothetical protein
LLGVAANKEKAQANENNKRAAAMVKLKREKEHRTWRQIAQELNLNGFKTSQGGTFQATQAMRLYKEVLN